MPKYLKGKSIEQIKSGLMRTIDQVTTIAGVEAVNHFKASFPNQGFTDTNLIKWKERKKKDEGRGILTKTGRLRRGIKVLSKNPTSVMVGVDLSEVPYAQVHNDGFNGTVAVRAHIRRNTRNNVYKVKNRKLDATGINAIAAGTRKMNIPRRQFVGNSEELNQKINKKVAAALKSNIESA